MSFKAAWVVPVTALPIRNGVVRVAGGRIVEIREASATEAADTVDLGNVALLPGFVNAHTHLELTDYAGKLKPGSLWDWLPELIRLRREPGGAEREAAAARRGALLSLAAGVTTVGDISRTGGPFEALLDVPIRKLCFHELISGAGDLPRDPDQLRDGVRRFLDKPEARPIADVTDLAFAGISPHALYSVAWNDLRRCVALAAELDLPMTMHLAETRDELEWLAHGTGRLEEFRAKYPTLDRMVLPQGDPMSLLHRSGMMHQHPLLAHCNYVGDAMLADLARSQCSVAFCPRAHRFFGHAPHRWREMLAAGINVCIGTDSLASNDSLSVLDELRFLRRGHRDISPRTLMEMGTTRAARALGMAELVGDLRPGLYGDLTAIPLSSAGASDVLPDLLEGHAAPIATWVGGVQISP